MITFLAAYFLVANNKVVSTGVIYNGMNIVGATAIAISLLPFEAWPTIALEVCFVLIGLNAIRKKLASKTAAGQ